LANVATTGAWSELGWSRRALGSGLIEGSGWGKTASTVIESIGFTNAAETST
jgi:hypothetical protein